MNRHSGTQNYENYAGQDITDHFPVMRYKRITDVATI